VAALVDGAIRTGHRDGAATGTRLLDGERRRGGLGFDSLREVGGDGGVSVNGDRAGVGAVAVDAVTAPAGEFGAFCRAGGQRDLRADLEGAGVAAVNHGQTLRVAADRAAAITG